jgi:hypothetical protein
MSSMPATNTLEPIFLFGAAHFLPRSQTSSGKTFTMTGTEELDGVVQFAVRDMFHQMARDVHRTFKVLGLGCDPDGLCNCGRIFRSAWMNLYDTCTM